MKKSKKMKRVISGVLSAAMLVNFCTVMPISAFAKDDESQETTIYSGHRYQLFDMPMDWNEAEAYCESLWTIVKKVDRKIRKSLQIEQETKGY